ncbi:MAG: histidine phosphatase family protein [Undibacterium sp.]|uniref:histidine phosphatase family protein n=1 Tax=Undibacterium sp. TaxID=1914977 RepID=UPI002717E4EA|nr:histidine phosphatase family protein [Undibacterium sp.]MDO8653433.1 histidine phosphatase family protein [Undibacterium sp.]
MQLYLIRHPQPDIAAGICYGQADIAVNEAHCHLVWRQLQSVLPAGIAVISSPLQRCARLACMLHPAPVFDARLMEMHFGSWEMQAWDDIARAEIDAWADDVAAYAPGRGENVIAMALRVINFLRQLAMSEHNEIAIVAHAGSIRLILAYQRGMQASDLAREVVHTIKKIEFGECVQRKRDL